LSRQHDFSHAGGRRRPKSGESRNYAGGAKR
jgi:hypothetical protein